MPEEHPERREPVVNADRASYRGAHTDAADRIIGRAPVMLTPAELARIEAAVPAAAVAGSRYDEHQMRILDSERSAK
jgi:hypothetical protein